MDLPNVHIGRAKTRRLPRWAAPRARELAAVAVAGRSAARRLCGAFRSSGSVSGVTKVAICAHHGEGWGAPRAKRRSPGDHL